MLIGRHAELRSLRRAFAAVTQHATPAAVHLRGPSGFGKTALARHFTQVLEAHSASPLRLWGRCFEHESVPYKGLDGLVDSLAQLLASMQPADAAGLLPADAAILGRVFPALLRVNAVEQASAAPAAADAQELRRRAFVALRSLFCSLAATRPVVVAVDDLQWSDVDSATFLRDLLAPPDPPAMLLIAIYRDDGLGHDPALAVLRNSPRGVRTEEVSVGPLARTDSIALVRKLLDGVADDGQAEVIAREAVGSPFFIQAMVRYVQQARRGGLPVPALQLESVLADLIGQLPGPARSVIEAAAVADVPRPIAVLVQVCGAQGTIQEALPPLRDANLIRAPGTDAQDTVEISHDQVKQVVLASLAPDALRGLHARFGEVLERLGTLEPEALLVHFRAAGDRARTWQYAVAAAERASASLAFSQAATLYRIALDTGLAQDRFSLVVRWGESLANAGKGVEAAEALLDAATMTTGDRARRLRQMASAELLKCGHVDRGTLLLAEVTREAGFHFPRTDWGARLSILWTRVRLSLRGLSFRFREQDSIASRDLERVDLCWSAGAALSNIDPIRGLDFQSRGLILALRLGEPHRLGRALVGEAAFLGMSPGRHARRIRRLLVLARTVVDRTASPLSRALLVMAAGMWCFFLGKWKDAYEQCESAASMFAECEGASWELVTSRHYAIWSLYYLGQLREMSRRVKLRRRAALADGDLYSATDMATANSNVAWLAADDPELARRRADDAIRTWSSFARQGFHVQHFFHIYAQVQADLYEGKGADAWDHLQAKWRQLERSLVPLVKHSRVEILQLRARCALAAAQEVSPERRDGLLKIALHDARRLVKENGPYSEGYDALLRAGVAATRGEKEPARTLLATAACAFERADMGLYAAAARWRLGELAGRVAGADDQARALEFLHAQEVRNPPRMVAMLAPGFRRTTGPGLERSRTRS